MVFMSLDYELKINITAYILSGVKVWVWKYYIHVHYNEIVIIITSKLEYFAGCCYTDYKSTFFLLQQSLIMDQRCDFSAEDCGGNS